MCRLQPVSSIQNSCDALHAAVAAAQAPVRALVVLLVVGADQRGVGAGEPVGDKLAPQLHVLLGERLLRQLALHALAAELEHVAHKAAHGRRGDAHAKALLEQAAELGVLEARVVLEQLAHKRSVLGHAADLALGGAADALAVAQRVRQRLARTRRDAGGDELLAALGEALLDVADRADRHASLSRDLSLRAVAGHEPRRDQQPRLHVDRLAARSTHESLACPLALAVHAERLTNCDQCVSVVLHCRRATSHCLKILKFLNLTVAVEAMRSFRKTREPSR